MRKVAGTLVVITMAAAPGAAQTNYDTVQVRTVPITATVYLLQGVGGNIAVSAGEDAVFVVDAQVAQLTKKIQAAIAELTSNPVRFVLNTHWHPDHAGGNENLGKAGAVLRAHENVRRRMSSEQFIVAQNRRVPKAPSIALPVPISDTAFVLNGDSIVVFRAPNAHTDGDMIVHFTKSNVIHMGDIFSSSSLPFIDVSSGGSINGIIDAVDKVLALSDDKTHIIPGHGSPANKARLTMYRDMLVTLRDRIRALVSTGKTVELILEMNITAPFAREFPGGHRIFVTEAHKDLTRK
ncbi:MAG TPA: MBL fold metallo-hydrolase [Gemmatimonadaceae bacterium]|jgi:cyclase